MKMTENVWGRGGIEAKEKKVKVRERKIEIRREKESNKEKDTAIGKDT